MNFSAMLNVCGQIVNTRALPLASCEANPSRLRCASRAVELSSIASGGSLLDGRALNEDKAFDAPHGQCQKLVHLLAREGRALGWPCTSIKRPSPVQTTFMSTSRARIFVVFEIKQRRLVNDANARGGDLAGDGAARDLAWSERGDDRRARRRRTPQ